MNNQKLVRVASYVSVLVALSLVGIKLFAWVQSDSVSILASLLDSGLDVVASIMIAIAVYIAQIPPDREHRFGHGNAEPIAALGQSVFIGGSALYLIIYSIERFLHPVEIVQVDLAVFYMALTLLITILLISFQRYVIFKTQSTAIRADSLHYVTDLAANFIVIVSLLLSAVAWIDPVLALMIGLWILWSAGKIAKDSSNQLLAGELSQADRQLLLEIIQGHPEVRGVNDLRTYQSGPNKFMQCDLELDDSLTLRQSHAITEEVTELLRAKIPNLDIMIHQEPVSLQQDPNHHSWGRD